MENLNPSKFYYSQATATLYYMTGNVLVGMPQYGNTFDKEESFMVMEGEPELANEVVQTLGGPKKLSEVWEEARKALT